MTRQRQSVLIVGGGIAGLTAASHLARNEKNVILLEKDSFLGGHAIGYTCKATEQCEQCDACTVERTLKEVSQDPGITVLLGSELESLSRNGRFEAVVRSGYLHDRPEEQEALAQAYRTCSLPGAIRRGPSKNNAPLYAVNQRVLREAPEALQTCLPREVLEPALEERRQTLEVDAVIVASGFAAFDPQKRPTYDYSQKTNLVSALELESIKRESGRYLRPSDRTVPGRVAFIQCVGSRNEDLGNLWCSRVCCPYALRMAERLRHESPESEVAVFYMDIQNIGKASPAFYERCQEDLRFIRNMPVDIYQRDDAGLEVSYLDESETRITREPFDLVVLSVGITPNPDNRELSKVLGLPLDSDGFFASSHHSAPAAGDPAGIFAAGTATGPMSIADSMAQAGQAVHNVLKYLEETT